MNVEFINVDGEKCRYTGVSYFQMGSDGVGFFNDDDLGFVNKNVIVTYAGPGHTGDVPPENEESMENEMADLRRKEQTINGMLIVGSFAYSVQDSEESDGQNNSSNDECHGQ